jgi:NAD(P)-dependent dehydrogenase (short-subunit alcohol dehydrogenase family)
MSLDGKRILIVGGGSGIGYAVAEGAVADGAQVILASSSQGRAAEAAAKLGNAAGAVQVDIKDEAAVAALFAGADPFDHIVTTAGDWGGPRRSALADADLDAAAGLFGVRFWGAVKLAKHGASRLNAGGSIVLTNGMIAHKPSKGSAISTAMAGAIEHLTRGRAAELAPLRVNCVCPGLILTGVWASIPADRRAAQLESMTAKQLVPRVGQPAEVAEAYLFLMRSGYTTGQVIHVEGGSGLS